MWHSPAILQREQSVHEAGDVTLQLVDKDDWDVCGLRISIHTMLKDAAMLSWLGLDKQVLPNREVVGWLVPMVWSQI